MTGVASRNPPPRGEPLAMILAAARGVDYEEPPGPPVPKACPYCGTAVSTPATALPHDLQTCPSCEQVSIHTTKRLRKPADHETERVRDATA